MEKHCLEFSTLFHTIMNGHHATQPLPIVPMKTPSEQPIATLQVMNGFGDTTAAIVPMGPLKDIEQWIAEKKSDLFYESNDKVQKLVLDLFKQFSYKFHFTYFSVVDQANLLQAAWYNWMVVDCVLESMALNGPNLVFTQRKVMQPLEKTTDTDKVKLMDIFGRVHSEAQILREFVFTNEEKTCLRMLVLFDNSGKDEFPVVDKAWLEKLMTEARKVTYLTAGSQRRLEQLVGYPFIYKAHKTLPGAS